MLRTRVRRYLGATDAPDVDLEQRPEGARGVPAESHHNKTKQPLGLLYDVFRSPDFYLSSKLQWSGALIGMPFDAIVTDDGALVTLDQWGRMGYEHAIVVYSPAGKLLRSHHLDALLPKAIADEDRSVSSRPWRRYARYAIDKRTLSIHLVHGVVSVSLADGAATYTPGKPAAVLPGTRIEVTRTELGYASLTDVARACKP